VLPEYRNVDKQISVDTGKGHGTWNS